MTQDMIFSAEWKLWLSSAEGTVLRAAPLKGVVGTLIDATAVAVNHRLMICEELNYHSVCYGRQ